MQSFQAPSLQLCRMHKSESGTVTSPQQTDKHPTVALYADSVGGAELMHT